jgi:hypothetical protein
VKKVFLLLASLLSLGSHASAGGMVGNGGDAVVQEFNLRGLQLAGFFQVETTVAQTYKIDAAKFLDVVKQTRLLSQDHLMLNGVEVDAINYPSQMRIEISRTRWADSSLHVDAYSVQRRIALHEYLWVYGIDDSAYVVSNAIIGELERRTQAINPAVETLLQQNFCDKIVAPQWDWAGALKILNWGLDLNVDCPANSNRDVATGKPDPSQPLLRLIAAGNGWPEQLKLFEAMLQFGANPNQLVPSRYNNRKVPLVATLDREAELLKILFHHGADPNLLNDDGETAFTLAAEDSTIESRYNAQPQFQMTKDSFEAFINADGDVNRGAAAVILAGNFPKNLTEDLFKIRKVDWCSFDTLYSTRLFDKATTRDPELVAKYNVSCPRFERVQAFGPTCEDAKAAARKKCGDLGYKKSTSEGHVEARRETTKVDCFDHAIDPSTQTASYLANYRCEDL